MGQEGRTCPNTTSGQVLKKRTRAVPCRSILNSIPPRDAVSTETGLPGGAWKRGEQRVGDALAMNVSWGMGVVPPGENIASLQGGRVERKTSLVRCLFELRSLIRVTGVWAGKAP